MHPVLVLCIGIFSVITLITVARLHAFVALALTALLISFIVPGVWLDTMVPNPDFPDDKTKAVMLPGKTTRMLDAFGNTAGGIAVLIGFASVIGSLMIWRGVWTRRNLR